MLEAVILTALGVWLGMAIRSCLRRRGKGGCDGRCNRCGKPCGGPPPRR